MKKIRYTMVLLTAAALLLTGCSGQQPAVTPAPSAVPVTASPTAVPTAAPTAAPTAVPVTINWHQETVQYTNYDGYKLEATVKYSPWILQSKKDLILGAWTEVGQGNELPTLTNGWNLRADSSGYYSDGKHFGIFMSDMYYLVGSISIRNITPDWHLSGDQSTKGNMSFGIYRNKAWPLNDIRNGNSNILIKVFYARPEITSYDLTFLNSLMTSDFWGPVSFVIAIPEYFAPKYPNGTAVDLLEKAMFEICGENFLFPIGVQN